MKHNKKQMTDRYLCQYERGIFLFQSACFILVGVGWLIGFLMTAPRVSGHLSTTFGRH